LDGTRDLLRRLPRARRAVVIGGGITALELTEGLAHHGVETHYFIRKGSLWSTVFNAEEAQLLEARMRSRGVHLHYHTEVEAILDDGTGHVGSVRLTGGDVFACDLLGAAIGVRPQLDLVRGTDLRVDRGLLVDEHLRTSVPEVFAAGDCAQIYDRWTGQHMLDVLWPSAVAAGRVAGANMAGANVAYQKGTPFNACLLFGLHITAIGQLGGSREEAGVEVVQHTSRGFSEVWATRPHGYASAWVQDGPNTLRLVLSDDRIVGALIVGEQSLADPLRDLIEWQVDATGLRPHLGDGVRLAQTVRRLWSEARLTHRPTPRVPA
jgi:NAD(P)H-nitrite reductase large subunit